jgi:hypothetical protein
MGIAGPAHWLGTVPIFAGAMPCMVAKHGTVPFDGTSAAAGATEMRRPADVAMQREALRALMRSHGGCRKTHLILARLDGSDASVGVTDPR